LINQGASKEKCDQGENAAAAIGDGVRIRKVIFKKTYFLIACIQF